MMFLSTYRSAPVSAVAAALTLLSAAPFLAAATRTEEQPPQISYDASSMEADIKTHVIHLKDVTITYGKMTVRANRALATSGDFKNSRWTFEGNVRIDAVPRGNLRSDEAVVEFEDNQLKRATATGTPAEFDQTREDANVIARGHANEIVYEVGEGTVRLSNNAWVTDGRDEMRGPVIVYSLRGERVEAMTSPGTERIHVTISPSDGPKGDGAGTNKPKPTQPDSSKAQPSTPAIAPAPGAEPSGAPPSPVGADPGGSPAAAAPSLGPAQSMAQAASAHLTPPPR